MKKTIKSVYKANSFEEFTALCLHHLEIWFNLFNVGFCTVWVPSWNIYYFYQKLYKFFIDFSISIAFSRLGVLGFIYGDILWMLKIYDHFVRLLLLVLEAWDDLSKSNRDAWN